MANAQAKSTATMDKSVADVIGNPSAYGLTIDEHAVLVKDGNPVSVVLFRNFNKPLLMSTFPKAFDGSQSPDVKFQRVRNFKVANPKATREEMLEHQIRQTLYGESAARGGVRVVREYFVTAGSKQYPHPLTVESKAELLAAALDAGFESQTARDIVEWLNG